MKAQLSRMLTRTLEYARQMVYCPLTLSIVKGFFSIRVKTNRPQSTIFTKYFQTKRAGPFTFYSKLLTCNIALLKKFVEFFCGLPPFCAWMKNLHIRLLCSKVRVIHTHWHNTWHITYKYPRWSLLSSFKYDVPQSTYTVRSKPLTSIQLGVCSIVFDLVRVIALNHTVFITKSMLVSGWLSKISSTFPQSWWSAFLRPTIGHLHAMELAFFRCQFCYLEFTFLMQVK